MGDTGEDQCEGIREKGTENIHTQREKNPKGDNENGGMQFSGQCAIGVLLPQCMPDRLLQRKRIRISQEIDA